MAYIGILLSRSKKITHVVSETLGFLDEKSFAKANNNSVVCLGKPLECCYYKDWSADSVVIEWL